MAEPTSLRPIPGARRGATVRYFEKPTITLFRMGREIAEFTGEHGSVDLRTVTARVYAGQVKGEGLTIRAPRIALHLRANLVVADGGGAPVRRGAPGAVLMEEHGITLASDQVVAPPSLVGHKAGGRLSLQAKDRDAAALLPSTRLL